MGYENYENVIRELCVYLDDEGKRYLYSIIIVILELDPIFICYLEIYVHSNVKLSVESFQRIFQLCIKKKTPLGGAFDMGLRKEVVYFVIYLFLFPFPEVNIFF